MRSLQITTIIFFATALAHAAHAVEDTLQNDGFTSGAPVTFQAGFVPGEMAAARFVPQIACPCEVEKISLLFGGANGTRQMGVNVWQDNAGADAPGALLYSGNFNLIGSNVNMQEIDLSLEPFTVNGPFRVGIEFSHSGVPTVATDLDGTINAAANFIFADLGGLFFWFRSAALGVSGDFVIRATINNFTSVDTDQDGIPDDADNCINVANADQRDTNTDGFGNACDGDLNNDCLINFGDVAEFAAAFQQPDQMDADLNGDGFVNFGDFAMLTAGFLMEPGPSGVPTDCDVRHPHLGS